MILSKLDVNKLNFKNHYKSEDALQRAVLIAISHPFNYCRILMQLGYEPLRPVLVNTLLGGSRYAHPSIFKYISFIRQEDGITGLFRGIGHRLCFELTNEFFYINTLDICKQIEEQECEDSKKKIKKSAKNSEECSGEENKDEERECACFDKESVFELLKKLCRKSVSRTVALTLSYPFHVCFIRSCSQFIGREKIYDFSPFNLVAIVKQGHFYDGFMPKLLAELMVLWVANSLIFGVDALIEPEKLVSSYLNTFINFFVSSFMYPFQLTSTVMAVNHTSSLLASKIEPPFYSWRACYKSLKRRNQLKRGSSLIWRYVANAYKPQAVIRPYLNDE